MTIINYRPQGFADWALTLCMCVLAVPVLIVFGPITLALRAVLKARQT